MPAFLVKIVSDKQNISNDDAENMFKKIAYPELK